MKKEAVKYEDGCIAVTGAASGLGAALVSILDNAYGIKVLAIDKTYDHDVTRPETLPACPDDLVALVNCAGINGAEWFEDLTLEHFDSIMAVNARAIVSTGQWALDALKRNRGAICNVISNASHMPMTSSLAYNASKAAAHIITQQLARELTKKYGVTVFGVSPNKLANTGMSKAIEENVQRVRGWSPEYAAKYQLDALLAGEETDARACAEFIAFLLAHRYRHKYISGAVMPYGV